MPTLHWIGKDKVQNHHLDVPFRSLEAVYTEGSDFSQNKIIHGDNLEALKALLPQYQGRVKCIYIDPPYNTGNEGWVYNDNVNDPKIKKWLAQVVGKEGEDLSRHDKWLCMMYPRLQLLKKLLADDGALVISIGHQEVFSLVQICKELFATMQIVCITVQTSGGKPSGGFNYQHEYLIFVLPKNFEPNSLLYSGGKARTPFEGLTLATFDKTQRPNQTYPIFVNDSDGSFAGTGESLQERIKNGTYVGKLEDFQYDFNEAPVGTVAIWPITSKGKDCVWRLIKSRLLNDWNKGYVKISPNKSSNNLNQYSIQYLPEGVIKKIEQGVLEVNGTELNTPTLSFGENKTVGSEIPTIWIEKSFYTVKGTTLLDDIFGSRQFNYPKSLEFITEILRALTSSNDIILDSFAGSGTTAHAVLNLNKADEGNRQFILIQMDEADKEGNVVNIAERITAERVRRVIKGYGTTEGTGGDFRYCELGERLFDEEGNISPTANVEALKAYIFFSETKGPLSINADFDPYFLGQHDNTTIYFCYEPDGITTLDTDLLSRFTVVSDNNIIYADNCVLSAALCQQKGIVFKKIPRDIRKY
jgi:adenine-specific DNA-methyltransferase